MGKRTIVVTAGVLLASASGIGGGLLQSHFAPAAQRPAVPSILHPLPVITSPVQPLDALRAGLEAKAGRMRAAACAPPKKAKPRTAGEPRVNVSTIPAPPQRPYVGEAQ